MPLNNMNLQQSGVVIMSLIKLTMIKTFACAYMCMVRYTQGTLSFMTFRKKQVSERHHTHTYTHTFLYDIKNYQSI